MYLNFDGFRYFFPDENSMAIIEETKSGILRIGRLEELDLRESNGEEYLQITINDVSEFLGQIVLRKNRNLDPNKCFERFGDECCHTCFFTLTIVSREIHSHHKGNGVVCFYSILDDFKILCFPRRSKDKVKNWNFDKIR